jgi:DNA-binding CsgD family transcriptional regulator
MFCPNCGKQLAENSKFCMNCGKALQNPQISPMPSNQQPLPQPSGFYSQKPANPLASAATIGGLGGMIGGALVILGWAAGGGLSILKLIFLGGGFLGILTGMLADEAGGIIILLLSFALAVVVLIVPVMSFLCVRTGISLIEKRSYTDHHYLFQVKVELEELRRRVAVIFVQIVLIFAFTSFIPFIGNKILGSGLYLAVIGAAVIFMSALFARSQIGPELSSSEHRSDWRRQQSLSQQPLQLSDREKQALILLAQGMLNQEIAKELGLRPVEATTLIEGLMGKFGAADTYELVKLAQKKGHVLSG